MTLAEALRHDFGGSVGVDEVEDLLIRPSESDTHQSWTLDLSSCRNVEPGAGHRLGAALRRLAAGHLTVLVPDPDGFSGQWFQTFTRSGIGLALATHADVVTAAGQDRTHDLRTYYASKGNVSSENYGVRTAIDAGGLTPNVDRFATTFEVLAARARLSPADLGRAGRRALATMAYEAALNVVDHAFAAPWAGPPGLSYLSVRWYRSLSAESSRHGGLRAYLQRANDLLSATEQALRGWAEIVVSDDGVGIAARHSQDPAIHRHDIASEDEALTSALSAASSVKLRTRDAVIVGEPGYGYRLIADALRQLGAYAAIRSGRRLIELDSTQPDPDFCLFDEVLGWLPGTALHIVIPVRDPQLRLLT